MVICKLQMAQFFMMITFALGVIFGVCYLLPGLPMAKEIRNALEISLDSKKKEASK